MYSQLGSVIFEGLFGFETFEQRGAVTYAQFDLINAKPVIKPTGSNLEEINIGIRLRAEFINVSGSIIALQTSRDEYEVLPLVKGTGQYIGDFVITDINVTDDHALADGTLVAATLQLTLLEYASADKLQQQQTAARKKAFALGDKQPLALSITQSMTVPQLAAADVSAVNSHSNMIDSEISQYENNVSRRQSLADKIQSRLQKIESGLDKFNERLNSITILNDIAGIISEINRVKQVITNFTFPVTSIDDLKGSNRDLQAAVRSLNAGSTELINLVITRRA